MLNVTKMTPPYKTDKHITSAESRLFSPEFKHIQVQDVVLFSIFFAGGFLFGGSCFSESFAKSDHRT